MKLGQKWKSYSEEYKCPVCRETTLEGRYLKSYGLIEIRCSSCKCVWSSTTVPQEGVEQAAGIN